MTRTVADTPGPGASPIPRLLSIAGSDSGGGAGIQADLKAFAACGAHGMTAITAITAQNTVGVTAVHTIPPEIIIAQVRAVLEDIGVDAVKIGMLGTVATIEAVAEVLAELPPGTPVVLDPVMVAESGAELLEPAARAALISRLLPLATVVTPNLPEARVLVGTDPDPDPDPDDDDDAPHLARAIHALGPAAAVVTGGHRDQATDVFYDGHELVEISGPRYESTAAHGSGCTHSSVLAVALARGEDPLAAARLAKVRAAEAVRDGLEAIGHGAGPVNVFGVT
jgi:hydroxymethylpyrimidine/phosphomethylpyrimidine kinase